MNIIVGYSCTRVLLYAKMLKETETEETIVFFVTFLSLVALQLGRGGGPSPPLATPMTIAHKHSRGSFFLINVPSA